MADEDYIQIPYRDRLELEAKHRRPDGEIDWDALMTEAAQRFPHLVGSYQRNYHTG